jgi:hypothetical protein
MALTTTSSRRPEAMRTPVVPRLAMYARDARKTEDS